jgi:hypothetical protein
MWANTMGNDTRYGASKRLYDEMERHDRQMLKFIVSVIILVLVIVISALSWVFL